MKGSRKVCGNAWDAPRKMVFFKAIGVTFSVEYRKHLAIYFG